MAVMARGAWAATLLLLVLLTAAGAKNGVNPSADLLLLDAARDPLGELDSFARLSRDDQETLWSYNEDVPLSDRYKAALEPLEVGVPVDVRLVGFDGDSNYGASIREADLLKYLEAAASDLDAAVLEPQEGSEHLLPIRYKVVYHVSKAGRGVASSLGAILSDAARDGRRAIRASAVQEIISRDYREASLTGYALYILNPPSPTEHGAEAAAAVEGEEPHYYLHDDEIDAAAGARSLTRCPSAVGVSADWRARVAWVDVSVPSPSSGPHASGDGFASRFSVPHLGRFLSRPAKGTAGPAAPRLSAAPFMAEAAAFVSRAVRHLFAPPARHAPPPHASRLRLLLTVVHESPAWRDAPSSSSASSPGKPDWEGVRALLEPLRLAGQEVAFERADTDFAECPACSAALHLARRSHTSTVLQGGLKAHVHEYLDSTVLAARLSEAFAPARPAERGAGARGHWRFVEDDSHGHDHGGAGRASTPPPRRRSVSPPPLSPTVRGDGGGAWDAQRVVRAFVYDLQTPDLLLLDRFHQAVGTAGGVAVAVQTRSGLASVDLVCGGERAAAWAVAPTHQHWSALHNETVDEWAFSACTGHTPFGASPLRRRRLRHLAAHFMRFRAEEGEVLRGEAHALFVRRWNVLLHKMHRAAASLALFNFNTTLYYARSARHELRALHAALKGASRGLHPFLHCYADPEAGDTGQILLAIVIVLLVCAATVGAIVVGSRRQREEAAARPKMHAH
eukprot:tig00000367_g24491.t1